MKLSSKMDYFINETLNRRGFLGDSDGKKSACNAGDPGSVPDSGRSSGEGNGYLWIARRSNQSILKEISPKYSLEGLMLKLKL